LADRYDETGKLDDEMKKHIPEFSAKLAFICDRAQARYPERQIEVPTFITKMCSFRNLFKCRRYGGYHHDRQLQQLLSYKKNMPEFNSLWDKIFEARKFRFDPVLLGELNGWTGIRKERQRLWIEKGMTGVEPESISSSISEFLQ
jgi:hypothetical protein